MLAILHLREVNPIWPARAGVDGGRPRTAVARAQDVCTHNQVFVRIKCFPRSYAVCICMYE